ncbi:MAG TPA: helix-turn-helix domain-containing protein [Polyangiaceae bacterium]|nr:helix-turn-helix domain-containing protein [Polyangiaceae bacterium]
MKCHECNGEKFERRVVELSTQVGDQVVVDRSVRLPVCMHCDAFVVPSSVLEMVELRAALVAFLDAPRVTGEMLRFARKALGSTQTELAARLSVSMESVSRWEREERPMEPWVPLAVLGLVRERLMPAPENVELKKTA